MEKDQFLLKLINQSSTKEMIELAEKNKSKLHDTKILYFGEQESALYSFKELTVSRYNLCTLGNYDKSWVIDENPKQTKNLKIKKVCFLDLNILIRVYEYMKGNKREDEKDFLRFMNILKIKGFVILPYTAILESLYDGSDKKTVKKLLISYKKFIKSQTFDGDSKYLELKKEDIDEIDRMIIGGESIVKNTVFTMKLNALKCMLLKAFLIKYSEPNKDNQINDFVKFCIHELKMFDVKDIYALCHFFNDSNENYFSKLQLSKKNIIQVINNIAWDLYHTRIALEIISEDISYVNNQISLVYFATNDLELNKLIKLNPLKFCIFEKNKGPQTAPEKNINDILDFLSDKNLINEIKDINSILKRKSKINKVQFDRKEEQLKKEVIEFLEHRKV